MCPGIRCRGERGEEGRRSSVNLSREIIFRSRFGCTTTWFLRSVPRPIRTDVSPVHRVPLYFPNRVCFALCPDAFTDFLDSFRQARGKTTGNIVDVGSHGFHRTEFRSFFRYSSDLRCTEYHCVYCSYYNHYYFIIVSSLSIDNGRIVRDKLASVLCLGLRARASELVWLRRRTVACSTTCVRVCVC